MLEASSKKSLLKTIDSEFELLEMDCFSFPRGACVVQMLVWPDASSHSQ